MAPRPKIDWEEAFSFYVSSGPRRSYGSVARRFGVSDSAVRKHAKKEAWNGRVKRIERESRQRAERAMVRDRGERLADVVRVADASVVRYAAQLREGSSTVRGADIAQLYRLAALLEGEATERVDLVDLRQELRRFAEVSLRFIAPEDREAYLTELEQLFGPGGVTPG